MKLHKVDDIEMNLYLSEKNYISSSTLNKLRQSPAHFKASLEQPNEETENLILGTAIHTALLEPELFEEKYVCWKDHMKPIPEKDYRTKENNDAKKAFYANAKEKGFEPISESLFEIIQGVKKSLFANPNFIALFKNSGFFERSIFFEDNGIKIKSRPDYYPQSCKFVLDIKTTKCAEKNSFMKSCLQYGYMVQAVIQTKAIELATGIKPHSYIYIAIEKTYPYCHSLFIVDDEYMKKGERDYLELLNRLRKCLDTNTFDGYDQFLPKENNGFQTLSLPHWVSDRSIFEDGFTLEENE